MLYVYNVAILEYSAKDEIKKECEKERFIFSLVTVAMHIHSLNCPLNLPQTAAMTLKDACSLEEKV